MSSRDLESECWNAHDDAEKTGEKLKALDLLVKIRLAGEGVKPDAGDLVKEDDSVAKALKEINQDQAQ